MLSVATPPETDPVPIDVPPSLKFTLPVGALPVTVAVNVTLAPAVDGLSELASVVARLRAGELQGLNVTVPHKIAVLDLVDEVAESARAVGAAVGKNPVSFVVPCHRVLGKSGDITGYHWGLTRKRAMLGWELGRLTAA